MSDEMTDEEVASLFGEPVPQLPVFNPNGIYQIAGRIKNHVVFAGFTITPNSEMICNTYSHMLYDFYQFALSLPEKERNELEALIRKQEDAAAGLISAAHRNVRPPKY